MMLAKRLPKAESQRRWRAHYSERIDKARRRHEKRVAGMDLVLRLDEGRRGYEFRGRQYGVPPVPWPLALELTTAQETLQALTQEPEKATLADWEKLCRSVARLFNRLTKPEGTHFLRRVLWRVWPSPARNCTIPEVVQLIGFFCLFRRLDAGVPVLTSPTRPPGTSQPTSSASASTAPRSASVGGLGAVRARSRGRPS